MVVEVPTGWTQVNQISTMQIGIVTTTEGGSVNIEATNKAALVGTTIYPVPGDVLVGTGMCSMYVKATNLSSNDYVIGVKWQVYDPDGIKLDDLEIGPAVIASVVKNGGQIEFKSKDSFNLIKEGTYTWNVEFFGRKNDPGFPPGSLTLYTLHSYVFEFNGVTTIVDPMSSMINMMMTIMMLSMMMGMMKGMIPSGDEEKGNGGPKKEFKNPEEPKPAPPTAKKEITAEKPTQQTQQQPIQLPSPIKRRVIEEY